VGWRLIKAVLNYNDLLKRMIHARELESGEALAATDYRRHPQD
jgi:hypothetical protein